MHDIFVKRLIALMEEKNISQFQLSILIGTTTATISRYINGKRNPRIEIIAKIAEVLNTSVDYLLGISNIKFPIQNNNNDLTRIINKLSSLKLLNSNNELSEAQIVIIEKLLDANKYFIEQLKDDNSKEA